MYGRCSANSTEKPWNGERCMPAMKPSTTSRARTSRCASRATIAGSSHWVAMLTPGLILPRGPLDVVALAQRPVAGGRARVVVRGEQRACLPAREARDVEQQLHLGLVDVAEVEREHLAPRHRATRIAELDPPQIGRASCRDRGSI